MASAPAAVSGLPPNVEIELAVMLSMISARATTPPIDRPLPMPLANVTMSGRAAVGVRLAAPEVLAGAAPAGLHLVG